MSDSDIVSWVKTMKKIVKAWTEYPQRALVDDVTDVMAIGSSR